jgi:hypothetical protein
VLRAFALGHWAVVEGLWRRYRCLLVILLPYLGVPDVFQHAISVILCLTQLIECLLILEDIDGYLPIVSVMLVNKASLLRVFAGQLLAALFIFKVYLATPCLAALP